MAVSFRDFHLSKVRISKNLSSKTLVNKGSFDKGF